MDPYILAQNNFKALKDQKIDLAVLPWGATEAHNYHLPYATDNIMTESIAAAAARRAWEKGGGLWYCLQFPSESIPDKWILKST